LAERRTPRDFDRTPDAVKGRAGVADASSLYHSRSALGAFHRRLKARLGAPKAITATAHKLACLIYRMLRFGSDYLDRGQDYYERRYQGRVVTTLMRRAQELGYTLTRIEHLSPAAP